MHISFIDLFVDPKNHSPLKLKIFEKCGDNIISGLFKSKEFEYPIIDGIPRFVSNNNYSSSFGFQWGKWPLIQFESENVGKPMEGHTTKMFDKITNNYSKNLQTENIILDIGCGSGRFIDLLQSRSNARIIGIDYSNAVNIANNNFKNDENICIVQANALELPFKSHIFNSCYSIGVLHHTPQPLVGVKEAHRVLKADSQFSVCVYERDSYYDTKILKLYRKIFSFTRPLLSFLPAILYSHITVRFLAPLIKKIKVLKLLIIKIFPYTDLPDKNWAILDTFDSITPTYASVHTAKEVTRWLREAGFKNIYQTDWGSTSYIAKK